MNEGLVLEKFAAQEPAKELIKWVDDYRERTLSLEGLFSSAKAFAMASSIKSGLHFFYILCSVLFPNLFMQFFKIFISRLSTIQIVKTPLSKLINIC